MDRVSGGPQVLLHMTLDFDVICQAVLVEIKQNLYKTCKIHQKEMSQKPSCSAQTGKKKKLRKFYSGIRCRTHVLLGGLNHCKIHFFSLNIWSSHNYKNHMIIFFSAINLKFVNHSSAENKMFIKFLHVFMHCQQC